MPALFRRPASALTSSPHFPSLAGSFALAWLLGVSLPLPAQAVSEPFRVPSPGKILAKVTLDPGNIPRPSSIVAIPLQPFLPPGAYPTPKLEALHNGKSLPVQLQENAVAWISSPALESGKPTTLELRVLPPQHKPADPTVAVNREGTKLWFSTQGQRWLGYQAEPGPLPRPNIDPLYVRGGYLHPLITPAGRLVTDDFPANHIHHHGIWSPWTKTTFEGRAPDFWNMGQGKGRVDPVQVDAVWSGEVFAGLRARHRFMDMTVAPAKAALEETWTIHAYPMNLNGRPFHVIDLTLRQQCSGPSPLKLPKYHYGGLGYRGHADWNGKSKTRFLTSGGETDRVRGNETRGNWCWVGGQVAGSVAGTLILCAPENFRAPQPMRLHPDEPFFCFAPSQLGDWEITPEKPYEARYRFAACDGEPDAALFDQMWQHYSRPIQVTAIAP